MLLRCGGDKTIKKIRQPLANVIALAAGRLRGSRTAFVGLQIACFLVLGYWATVEALPWTYRAALAPASFHHEIGHAFVVDLPRPALPLTMVWADNVSDPRTSHLVLLESGRSLGPAHSLHADIREQGRGRFSFWVNTLHFSSSDNSDPATNGRLYLATAPVVAAPLLDVLAAASLFLAMASDVLFPGMLAEFAPRYARALDLVRRGFFHVSTWPSPRVERWLIVVVAAGLVAVSFIFVYADWTSRRSLGLALGGILPIADAYSYYACANSLIDLGHFVPRLAAWCSRRPIYSSFLAPLIGIGGRNFHIALLAQAAVVSLALVALAREVLRLAGVASVTILLIILVAYASRNAYGLTMSENAGLAFGAVALALLLRGAETGRAVLIYSGIALMSVGLNARAGCFFVLPMLVLWAAFDAHARGRNVAATVVLAVAAMLSGFALEFALVAVNSVPLTEAQSNFAFTLYGLSLGGKGWMQAYTDHPELASLPDFMASAAVYRFAFENIVRNPGLILHALAANFIQGYRQGLGLVSTQLYVAWSLWFVGFFAIGMHFRNPRYTLLGALTIGGLLSAPIIVVDGGERAFAATISADAAQAAVGMALICRALAIKFGAPLSQHNGKTPYGLVVFAVLLIVGTLIGYTPVRKAVASPTFDGPPCPNGERTVVTRLGADSIALVVTADGEVKAIPPTVPLQLLLRYNVASWAKTDMDQPTPYTLMLAYQQWRGSRDFAITYPILWRGDLSADYGKRVRVCYGSGNSWGDEIWGRGFVAHSVNLLDGGQETTKPAGAD